MTKAATIILDRLLANLLLVGAALGGFAFIHTTADDTPTSVSSRMAEVDAWDGCERRPTSLGQDVLAITLDGTMQRMTAGEADAIDHRGRLWVVGYCR